MRRVQFVRPGIPLACFRETVLYPDILEPLETMMRKIAMIAGALLVFSTIGANAQTKLVLPASGVALARTVAVGVIVDIRHCPFVMFSHAIAEGIVEPLEQIAQAIGRDASAHFGAAAKT